MRNVLAFLAAVVVTVVAVGWFLDWYKVHSLPAPAGHRHLTIDINTVKIGADLHKGEQNLQKMLENSGKPQAIGSAKAPPAEADKKGPAKGARAEHPEGATARTDGKTTGGQEESEARPQR
jgi:hypothetical protein